MRKTRYDEVTCWTGSKDEFRRSKYSIAGNCAGENFHEFRELQANRKNIILECLVFC